MDTSIKVAYAEVDTILNLMDDKYKNKIPQKLKELIKLNKLEDYTININPNIPLEKQKINKKTLAILAVLNYNYWSGQLEKEELVQKYKNNQQQLQEKYDINKLFKNKNTHCNNNLNTQLMVYKPKENFIIKIINKIKKLVTKS